jgi:hypothetical protein
MGARLSLGFASLLIGSVIISGCASIVEGTTQQIVVNTTPSGAFCNMTRDGMPVGQIASTPGAVTVKKTKQNIVMECTKDGFHKLTYYNKSDVEGATFGNIILGGGIGWIVDSSSGADNKYTSPINISMVPIAQPAPAPIYSKPPEEKPAPQEAENSERH